MAGSLSIPSGCQRVEAGSLIARQQRRSRIEIPNPQRLAITVIDVDDCMKLHTQKQCDFLFHWGQDTKKQFGRTELYVELKGSDLAEGEKQLRATLSRFGSSCRRIICVIVYHHCGLAGKDELTRMKRQFLKDTGYSLLVERSPYKHYV